MSPERCQAAIYDNPSSLGPDAWARHQCRNAAKTTRHASATEIVIVCMIHSRIERRNFVVWRGESYAAKKE